MKEDTRHYGENEKKFILEKHEDRVIVQVGNVIVDIGISNPSKTVLVDIYGYARDKANEGVVTIGKGQDAKRIFLESEKL